LAGEVIDELEIAPQIKEIREALGEPPHFGSKGRPGH
jgi:hypothetical protein